jgi:hypothetical protein
MLSGFHVGPQFKPPSEEDVDQKWSRPLLGYPIARVYSSYPRQYPQYDFIVLGQVFGNLEPLTGPLAASTLNSRLCYSWKPQGNFCSSLRIDHEWFLIIKPRTERYVCVRESCVT